jgi:hypothetical protein
MNDPNAFHVCNKRLAVRNTCNVQLACKHGLRVNRCERKQCAYPNSGGRSHQQVQTDQEMRRGDAL